jgi:ferredoxin--NADP+ reductase
MLFIDPRTCIDCGACVDVCPVEAIVPHHDLTDADVVYADINAQYFDTATPVSVDAPTPGPLSMTVRESAPLRVAIVGCGPSGCFAAEELLSRSDGRAEVDIFERLPMPWGLVRYGVAPDHQGTKAVTRLFSRTVARDDVELHFNVRIGEHLTHEELLAHHHAVIYAVGAAGERRLGIPGESMTGSHSAGEFVSWYNGHPDYAQTAFDLSSLRAVIVGNGNVALDIARVLASDVDTLARTDIADHALDALAESAISEVVILGRRGPEHAAFTLPELIGADSVPDYDLVVEPGNCAEIFGDPAAGYKTRAIAQIATRSAGRAARKRVVLRFHSRPVAIAGDGRVAAMRIAGPHGDVDLSCGLVVRSIGFHGQRQPGVLFDDAAGTMPHEAGRVCAGVYTAGWIKRGPTGGIGTNKWCAKETVDSLVEDYTAGRLAAPAHDREHLRALLAHRQPNKFGYAQWKVIDAHERALGQLRDRPRTKLVDTDRVHDVVTGIGVL